MSICLYPPIGQTSQETIQKKPECDFSKLRDTVDKCFADSVSQGAQIPQFDTYGREWCAVCQEYLCAGHLHKGSPEYNEMNEKAREMGMCFDGLQRHAVNPNHKQVNHEIHLSPDYIRDSLQVLKADVKYLADEIKKLFRWMNDISELRHETNQNEGCTRAKVENDLMPQVAMLWEDGAKLRKNFESLCEHMGKRTTDFEIKDCEFHERLKKLEQTPCMNEWVNKTESRLEKLEGYMQMENLVTCSDMLFKFDDIYKSLAALQQEFRTSNNNRPHKCPICNGKGSTTLKELTDGTPFIVMPCSSCEGKGIVWG